MLDWFPNPDHVAIYQAIESGYFRDVSLDVRPRVPSDPAAPDQAGRSRAGRPRDLLRARGAPRARAGPSGGRGRRARAAAADVADGDRRSPACVPCATCAESGSARPGSRTRRRTSKTILRRANVPKSSVKVTNVGASLLPAMLSGKVDATLGAFWNVEGVELRQRRQRPWIVPVNRLGVPDYDELVLVANSDKLDDQRDDLRLFISALVTRRPRGAPRPARRRRRAARRQQGPEGQAHPRERARHDPDAVPGEAATSRSATWTRSSGATTAAGWSTTGCWTSCPDIEAAITNDLLPGAGL